MCKIAVITTIKEGKEEMAFRFAEAITGPMTKGDRDGFGYMALSEKGLYGERWLDPKDAWKRPTALTKDERELVQAYGETVEADQPVANRFGKHSGRRTFSMALHSRAATCEKSLQNVHPFVARDRRVGIIHNGVIGNSALWKLEQSTCDSESILLEYQNSKVASEFKNIHAMVNKLAGWYAVAAFSRAPGGQWHLDIFKDTASSLEAAYIPALGSMVFCTKLHMIRDACRKLGWKVGAVFQLSDDMAWRHDAFTGKVLETLAIDSVPYAYRPSADKYSEGWGQDDAGNWRWNRDRIQKLADATGKPVTASPVTVTGAPAAGAPERFLPAELRAMSIAADEAAYDLGESDGGDSETDGEAEFNQGGGLHDDGPLPVDEEMARCAKDPYYFNPGYGY